MTQYKYVSVHEYTSGPKEGKRFLKFGKGDASGSDIQLSTPNNDIESMKRMERERVLTWQLPEKMAKEDVKDYLEAQRPGVVWSALETDNSDKENDK